MGEIGNCAMKTVENLHQISYILKIKATLYREKKSSTSKAKGLIFRYFSGTC